MSVCTGSQVILADVGLIDGPDGPFMCFFLTYIILPCNMVSVYLTDRLLIIGRGATKRERGGKLIVPLTTGGGGYFQPS